MALFVSDQDAGMMLNGTVLERNNRLIVVHKVSAAKAIVQDLEIGEEFRCPADLDVILPPKTGRLGYLNTSVQSYYVQRSPLRTTKLGLFSGNLKHGGTAKDVGVKFNLYGSRIAGLINTYFNKYPTFAEAFAAVTQPGGPKSVAYDRSWCLIATADKEDVYVFFKGVRVGIAPDNKEENVKFAREGYRNLMKVRNRPQLQWR